MWLNETFHFLKDPYVFTSVASSDALIMLISYLFLKNDVMDVCDDVLSTIANIQLKIPTDVYKLYLFTDVRYVPFAII